MSSIGGMSGSSAMMQGAGGMRGMHRPDPAKMAENLFSQLDSAGQGYIQKTDLQSALETLSSSSPSSLASSTDVDNLFAALDTNSDGKVTKQEFTDTLEKLQDSLDQQFQDGRMQMAMQAAGMGGMNGMGGMPPPPPPQAGSDQGFTKDELSSQLEEIGSSDSKLSSLISSIVQNFDDADTDGDGKVSFQEAMAYQQSTNGSGATQDASATASLATTASATTSGDSSDAKLMMQIMNLMRAYTAGDSSALSSTLSISA
jgi:Ca2+-binding EF-hand superfamily protein